MRKNRTSGTLRHRLRQGLAVFVATAALWLVWLTADPISIRDQLGGLAGDTRLALSLLSAELGPLDAEQLSAMDRLVLAQSSLLSGTPTAQVLSPPPVAAGAEPSASEVPDEPELPITTTAPDGIIGKTMVAGSSASYVTSGNVSIYNRTDYELDVGALLAAMPELTDRGDGPQVLIYHSHATEAYTMDGTDVYEESDSYRTLNTDQNVVRVGAEMTAILESAGIEVIHDTTLFDYPSYNDAYNRSYEAVTQWLEQYPSIQLVIDVHRDALAAADGTIYKTVAGTVDNCAQIMLVMGSDALGQVHPNWRVNLSLAVGIQKALTDKWATLARPIVLRTSRFNQHLSTGAILVEVGTHGNTLQEAITAGRLFARTIADLLTQ
ncbi:MAG: stage II sporulation protein P [Candidatus Enterenecus sp.]